jgi:hypothetical protein
MPQLCIRNLHQKSPILSFSNPRTQKRTLVHPLLDRAERVFDRLAAFVEDVGALRYAGLHSVQYSLVLETGHGAELIARGFAASSA